MEIKELTEEVKQKIKDSIDNVPLVVIEDGFIKIVYNGINVCCSWVGHGGGRELSTQSPFPFLSTLSTIISPEVNDSIFPQMISLDAFNEL